MTEGGDVIRNIPPSVLSDILNIDRAIAVVAGLAEGVQNEIDWEEVLGVLEDARSAMIYLAEKHDKMVVQLQEHTE
jgi:hypothetical protein